MSLSKSKFIGVRPSTKIMEKASTALEVAFGILELLPELTENVPYLNVITGCIKKLMEMRKIMDDNKTRAAELLNNIGVVSLPLAEGLRDLIGKSIAASGLKDDLEKYQVFLVETCQILEEWTSKNGVKRFFKRGEFAGLADGIDKRLNAFRDAFAVSRLTDLSSGQDILKKNLQKVVDSDTREKMYKWLSPAVVATNQRNAENKCHPETGLWLLTRPEFVQWIYAPKSLLWLEGISGSGKTVLSSTIIRELSTREEPLAFFYFDTNTSGQRDVSHLLCSLVFQLSIRAPLPDKTLHALWRACSQGQLLLSNSDLIQKALIPILKEFDKPVYLLLDALDECSNQRELLVTIAAILEADLANLHVLLTSRSEVLRSNNALTQKAAVISLQNCTQQDLELYLIDQLSSFDFDWSQEQLNKIKDSLIASGNGMFRLVALQLDELRQCGGSEQQVNEVLATIPKTLDAIYDRIVSNIKTPSMASAVWRAMHWLIFSERPLMVEEIIDALAFNFETEPLRFSPTRRMQQKAFIEACAGLVIVSRYPWTSEVTINLAHASVKEYFLSTDRNHHFITEQTAHHLLTRTCISYLCSMDHDETDNAKYPLAKYAARNWPFHIKLCDEIRLAQCTRTPPSHKPYAVDTVSLAYSVLFAVFPPLAYLLRLLVEHVKSSGTQRTAVTNIYDQSRLTPRLVDTALELLQDIRFSLNWEGLELCQSSHPAAPPLHICAALGLSPLVSALLVNGAEVNVQGGYYGNALQAASSGGQIEIVRLLLECGAEVNMQGGYYGNALQAASSEGHIEIVRLLLEGGAEVNVQDGDYNTALRAASNGGHIEITRLLIEHGAELNAPGGFYGNALQAASQAGHIEIVRLLVEHGAELETTGGLFGNALQASSNEGHTEITHLLIEHGAKVNVQGGEYGNVLQAVTIWGHIEIARLLLEHGAEVNAQGGEYGNALQAASQRGHIGIARLLLEHGAEVNVQSGQYGNALQGAASGGHIEIVHLLVEHGAEVNVQGGKYGNALQAASQGGHMGIVHLLVEHCAEQAAPRGGYIEIVRLLLEHGAEVNVQGGYYGNALQAASSRGHIEIVRLLLECGAEVNVQGGYYGNALQAASSGEQIEIVRLLLEWGAEVNVQGGYYGNALQAASSGGQIEIVRLLLERGAEVNAQGGYYGSVLQAALQGGHIEIEHLLLECGAQANAQGRDYDNAPPAPSHGQQSPWLNPWLIKW